MKTYVTSDIHFGHANILKYNPTTRQYLDADHMNTEIIRVWNNTVQDKDTVYILGDVAFTNARDACALVRQLKGRKILIAGNHDSKLLQSEEFRQQFAEIHQYLEIRYNRVPVCMFHYPISTWNRCHYGAVHLHGHCHGYPTGIKGKIKDVGIDATGNVVTLLDDIIEELKDTPYGFHHEGL